MTEKEHNRYSYLRRLKKLIAKGIVDINDLNKSVVDEVTEVHELSNEERVKLRKFLTLVRLKLP